MLVEIVGLAMVALLIPVTILLLWMLKCIGIYALVYLAFFISKRARNMLCSGSYFGKQALKMKKKIRKEPTNYSVLNDKVRKLFLQMKKSIKFIILND